MIKHFKGIGSLWAVAVTVALSIAVVFVASPAITRAAAPLPKNPQSGSIGLEGVISSPPPSRGATITNPTSGRSFSSLPVTVSGICPDNTLVKLFSNNIFIGSTTCTNGNFTLQVDLFNGQNDLIARVYDTLDQAGPDSNTVTVNFSDPQLTAVGNRVTLTSNFARMGANPGQNLSWPILLSGGSGPYALSVDWGDGKPTTLKSIAFPGAINIDHTYDQSGVYRIIVKATDTTGQVAFLQLVGVANGNAASGGTAATGGKDKTVTITKTQILIWPSLAAIPLILLTFWVGRRYELLSIRKRIENSASSDF